MVDLNGNTAEGLKAKGFDVTNAADYAVLTSAVNSSLAQARGVSQCLVQRVPADSLPINPGYGHVRVYYDNPS